MSHLINAYSTFLEPAPFTFAHQLNSRRDRSDPEFLEHLNGFTGFVLQCGEGWDAAMSPTRYAVLRHIQRTQHQFSLNVEDNHIKEFAEWAWDNNCIVFLTDNTVRDPSANVLIAPGRAKPDKGAQMPYPDDAHDRRAKTIVYLNQQGLPVNQHLPPVLGEPETELRPAEIVAQRAMALFVTSRRARSFVEPDREKDAQLRRQFPAAFEHLSPAENGFLNDHDPDPGTVKTFTGRLEALQMLLWTLHIVEGLPDPGTPADEEAIAAHFESPDAELYLAQSALRPLPHILDMLDLHYCLHWATRETRVHPKRRLFGRKKIKILEDVDEAIVAQRHLALNWLTQFENVQTAWDQVQTPT